MAIDVYGILYMTKKWSVPENVDNNVNNPSMKKQHVQNETWTKTQTPFIKTSGIWTNPNTNELLRTGVCPNCVRQLFLNPLVHGAWQEYRMSPCPVLSYVMSPALLGVYEHMHDLQYTN